MTLSKSLRPVRVCVMLCLLWILTGAACTTTQWQFEPQQSLPVAGKFRTVAVADLDGDGIADVVGGGEPPGALVIWYGDGSGRLQNPLFLPLRASVRSIAVADFNEDGRKDLAVSVQGEASGVMIWENQGMRRWQQAPNVVEINAYEGIRTADVNRDGHMDVVAANFTSELQGGIQVWLGNGKGGWSGDRGPTVHGRYMDVAVADFNGDGLLDLAGAGWGTPAFLRVWTGDRSGGWTAYEPVASGNFNRLTATDMNGDGHMDLLTGTYRSGIRIWQGDGSAGFRKRYFPVYSGSFWKVHALDLNGDGRKDILAGSIDNQGIVAVANKMVGGWTPIEGRFPTAGIYYDIALADVNLDDAPDICAATYGEGVRLIPGRSEKPAAVSKKHTVKPRTAADMHPPVLEENAVFKMVDGWPEYKIGPGDAIEIRLWKGIEATNYALTVRPDGKISFGLLEDLTIAGRTANEVDELITGRLREFIRVPRVDVLVTEPNSKFVKIMGPGFGVHNRAGAGRYALAGRTTLVEMLTEAGGLHSRANLSRVRVQRKNGQALNVDLFKVITLGETGQDVLLDDGDLIYVPIITESENRVYVLGEVGSPGAVAFTGSEMRLLDAILKAGGVTPFSTPASTKIVRGDPTHPAVISVDLDRLMKKADVTQNVALANGDFVFVPRSVIGDINAFLAQIQPILNLAYTPSYILDIPSDLEEAYESTEDAFKRWGIESEEETQ